MLKQINPHDEGAIKISAPDTLLVRISDWQDVKEHRTRSAISLIQAVTACAVLLSRENLRTNK